MAERLVLLVLFGIGLAGIVACRNIIRKIIGLTLINSAVVLLFVIEGARIGHAAPIVRATSEPDTAATLSRIVDPVPQALMLTAIVIGVCVSALALALAFRLYKVYGTFDIDAIHLKVHADE